MVKVHRLERYKAYNDECSKVAITNMAYKDHAPQFVSLIGTASSGKSTILRQLVKHHTGEEISPAGPLTLKTKTKRVTFYESTNELNNIIDTIKVADIVVIPLNIHNGLEKEILEFINMVNSYGQSKFFFIFTRLGDKRREVFGPGDNGRTVKEKMAKRIKQEFSYPIKLFDMEKDGIMKIARALDLIKSRPVEWRCVHPFFVPDRFDSNYVYGYLRGGPLKAPVRFHVPGAGDFSVSEIVKLEDPCGVKQKKTKFYNPAVDPLPGCTAINHDEPKDTSNTPDELNDTEESDIQSFAASEINDSAADDNSSIDSNSNDNFDSDENNHEGEESSDEEDSMDEKYIDEEDNESEDSVSSLLKKVKGKFRTAPKTEEELKEKFEREYKESEECDGMNFLQREKKMQIEKQLEIGKLTNALIPGEYCRIKVNLKWDLKEIRILGSYMANESFNIFVCGKITKNKWQKNNLISNSPYMVSMGWWRFQSIPIFSQENMALKELTAVKGSSAAEVVFYGPSVSVGTSFFIFGPNEKYRVLASGQVSDACGEISIKKKQNLVGYPKKLMGNNVIIQAMFSSDKEADGFIGARLQCASGIRGQIKSSIGHGGDIRAGFEAPLLMSDVVALKCYIPVTPVEYFKNIRDGEKYVRGIKELGIEESEESSDTVEEGVENVQRYKSTRRIEKEIKELETKLPFEKRKITEVKESLDLPVPPEQRAFLKSRLAAEEKRKINEAEEAKRLALIESKKEAESKGKKEIKVVKQKKTALESKAMKESGRKKKMHKKKKFKKNK
ncbi:ribosome biogenesis protein BMS1 [Enteropsectra breve]|nr:ribosome biogenesis protein BMS1 [Enteropsectra breve]